MDEPGGLAQLVADLDLRAHLGVAEVEELEPVEAVEADRKAFERGLHEARHTTLERGMTPLDTLAPDQRAVLELVLRQGRSYGELSELLAADDEEVRARVPVRDELRQPMGLVHGGVFASIAESMASIATWMAVQDDGKAAHGMSSQTSFLRPIVDGTIHAVARRRHKGRTTWVWEVDVSDDQERLCALVRTTVAVRDAV